MQPQEILNDLKGVDCLCGAAKMSGRSFCPRCFKTLDPEKRHALYNKVGGGYEEAFINAIDYLRSKGRIKDYEGKNVSNI